MNQTAPGPKPTIILVHGLWAVSSCWSKVNDLLTNQGYTVKTVDLPTTTLEGDVEETIKVIESTVGDVILVGHSWGGFVITEAGAHDRVKRLVYVAAYAPDAEESVATLNLSAHSMQGFNSVTIGSDGRWSLTKAGFTDFAHDLTTQEQDDLFAAQESVSPKVFLGSVKTVAWKTKPSWYVVASEDKIINPDLEKRMAKRATTWLFPPPSTIADSRTTILKCSHIAIISQADKVADVILEAAK